MQEYVIKIIISLIVLALTVVLRKVVSKIIRKYVNINQKLEARANHIIRVCYIFINSACLLTLVIIWGVDPRNLFVALSSIFTIIGVAFFAQWSILSNVTAGVVIFFTAPYKVGDEVKIVDKDMPIEAQVEEIFSFYTHLRSKDGCLHVLPNTMMLQKAITIISKTDEL